MHTYNNDLRQFPGLGDIPVLGALFRSARWARNETELIIIVTPHIVTARDFEKAAKTTDIAGKEPAAGSFMINGVVTKDPPMSRDMRGPIAPPPPSAAAAAPAPVPAAAATAVSAATSPALPLRGEISAPAVPASGK
jgi:pilus assembly protein CpaC